MNLYTADLHFGHKNVIGFDHRPFFDIEEMDRVLIELWNSRVAPDDNVYVVGDFAYRNEKEYTWYLRKLRGHKHLIIGNHDNKLLEDEQAMSYFESVDKMMDITDGEYHLTLCHYPIVEWNAYYHGSYHIYGHIHNRRDETYEIMKKKDHALNAGCMINNYTPASFRELLRNNETFRNSADMSMERTGD